MTTTAKYNPQGPALKMSAGRDYRLSNRYEYCIFQGDEIVARAGCYMRKDQAVRAGLKVAAALVNAE